MVNKKSILLDLNLHRKPEIIRKIIKNNDIVEIEIKTIVKKYGGSAVAIVPKELFGKSVNIKWKKGVK